VDANNDSGTSYQISVRSKEQIREFNLK